LGKIETGRIGKLRATRKAWQDAFISPVKIRLWEAITASVVRGYVEHLKLGMCRGLGKCQPINIR
jgi:hypothetical protein